MVEADWRIYGHTRHAKRVALVNPARTGAVVAVVLDAPARTAAIALA